MKSLAHAVKSYKKTPEFTEQSVPKGLLNDHQTKAGVWGKIVILEGELDYTILEPEKETIRLSIEQYGVVEPTMLHFIKPCNTVRFYVEFYK
jgi:tellurite resistance-related uncharacterized protein